jgi:[ribosomal protein S5]-alanine N-acetyltransferase
MKTQPQVQLRPLEETDKTALAQLADNKNVWDNLRDIIPHPYTEQDAETFIRSTRLEDPRLTFAIAHRDELCGVIGLVPGADVHRRGAEIGYWIGEPFWGKGIATEAVHRITQYGFQELGLARIYTGVMAHNTGSIRVLGKNGYDFEGTFRKSIFKNGVLTDEHRFAKLNPLL